MNCCNPELVPSLLLKAKKRLEEINKVRSCEERIENLVLIAYPNSGELWCAESGWYSDSKANKGISSPNSRGTVCKWVDSGARIIGGCCRVGPREIREIGRILSREGRIY